MTTLYKSPDIVIGDYECHLMVHGCYYFTMHYFRPLSAVKRKWSNITAWKGGLHPQFRNRFAPYRRHALIAIALHEQRGRAVLARERVRAAERVAA
jgi:hypothetical protein